MPSRPPPSQPTSLSPIDELRAPLLLVVDADPLTRRATARALCPDAITRPVATLAGARELLAGQPIAGVVTDLDLPDGSGLSLLDELGRRWCHLPTLVLSATDDVTAVSRACGRGASFVSKREPAACIAARLAELARAAASASNAREALATTLAHRHHLTPAEAEALICFVRTGQRGLLAGLLDIAETSVRSRVRGVCRKLDIPHLESVYRLLFEAALQRPTSDAA